MAAGTFTNNFSQTLNVSDSSCASVKQASNLYLGSAWQATTCSSDPVVVGTSLNFTSPAYGFNLQWTVTAITATPPSTSSAICNSDLMCQYPVQDLIFVASCVFALFFGFSNGKSL
jgi:hypothetical protein